MIESLPQELLAEVLDALELADLSSIRLTSRQLERKSAKAFGAAAFSEVRVDFSRANLEWIGNIASRDDFRLAVRRVRLGRWDGKTTGATGSHTSTHGHGGRWSRLEDGTLDYGASEPARRFADSLLRFPNCTTVTVTDDKLTPLNEPRHNSHEEQLSSADAMGLVLHALSSTDAPSLRCLHICLHGRTDWYPPSATISTAVSSAEKALRQLEELTLELDKEGEETVANLLQLVTICPDLRTLRILLPRHLEAPLLPQHLHSLPHFTPPRLETVLLCSTVIDQEDLERLLSSSPDTLARLDLGQIRLTSGRWTDVLEHLRATPFRRLRHFSMFACRDGPAGECIAFCPLWASREEREAPDVSLYFRVSMAADAPDLVYHVTGALFKDAAGHDAAGRALRMIAECNHRCPVAGGEPWCVRRSNGRMAVIKEMVRVGIAPREQWFGLS